MLTKKLSTFILLITYLPCIATNPMHTTTNMQPGIIILLNGTSSAGKTTLAQEFCEQYPLFQRASLDDYTRTHPCGSWFTKCCNFYKSIREKALNGQHVIVDTVLYHEYWSIYDALLQQSSTPSNTNVEKNQLIKVLVYCPITQLIDHVHQRNAEGNSLEKRTMHKALVAFLALYTVYTTSHHHIIDTIDSVQTQTALQQAYNVINKKLSKLMKKQHKINKKITYALHLDCCRKVNLAAQHPWDLVVNTALDTTDTIIERIQHYAKTPLNI